LNELDFTWDGRVGGGGGGGRKSLDIASCDEGNENKDGLGVVEES
jgi:hypothetical protein